jgi:hypothetical protein
MLIKKSEIVYYAIDEDKIYTNDIIINVEDVASIGVSTGVDVTRIYFNQRGKDKIPAETRGCVDIKRNYWAVLLDLLTEQANKQPDTPAEKIGKTLALWQALKADYTATKEFFKNVFKK